MKHVGGFTLVELVSTLVIVGILAVVATPRFFDRQTYDTRAFSDRAQGMIRHAQKIAIAQNRNVHVRLDGTRIAVCFNPFAANGACTAQVIAPAGRNSGSAATLAACGNNAWFCEAIPVGINFAAAPAVQGFFFNALGRPFLPTDTPPNSGFGTMNISLTGGGITRNIVIEAETGYVHP